MNAPSGLPQRVDPYRLASVNGLIEGDCVIDDMPRLKDYLFAPDDTASSRIQVTMRFYRDNQRRVVIEGEVNARLRLQCQRCLQALDWPLETQLKLAVVGDDDRAAQVPREYDPLIVDDEGLSPVALVEDELILAMPAVARCETPSCSQKQDMPAASGRSKNPFAELRSLKFDN